MYEVGFKDVYPWVWSVMFGTALMLAERRGAFLNTGTHSAKEFWIKNFWAILINVVLPAVLFGLTMIRVGPQYSQHMDFWQILGSLYLAGVPLGSHHLWLTVASRCGWIPAEALQIPELETQKVAPFGTIIWSVLVLGIPCLIAIFGRPLPY